MAVSTDWARRRQLADWIRANGIDPHTVPVDGDLTIIDTDDGRAIHIETFTVSETGALMLDARGENAARETREVPLVADPPAWFEPFVKPTREQLLATVEQVRKLHAEEYGCCSHCTREDSVLFPCPTVAALNGQEQPGA
jgi:hypothetical protein